MGCVDACWVGVPGFRRGCDCRMSHHNSCETHRHKHCNSLQRRHLSRGVPISVTLARPWPHTPDVAPGAVASLHQVQVQCHPVTVMLSLESVLSPLLVTACDPSVGHSVQSPQQLAGCHQEVREAENSILSCPEGMRMHQLVAPSHPATQHLPSLGLTYQIGYSIPPRQTARQGVTHTRTVTGHAATMHTGARLGAAAHTHTHTAHAKAWHPGGSWSCLVTAPETREHWTPHLTALNPLAPGTP